VGQTLSLASMKLRRLTQSKGADQKRGYQEIDRLLGEVRERISSLSFQISPPILYDVGLVAAAEWLAEDLERRYGLVASVVPSDEPAVDEATRITLYRALRELLVNVAKHSGVHEAHVRIFQEGNTACMEVTDGGKGFDPTEVRRGFGLLALRERVGHLGGTVTIASADGCGARVVVRVPSVGNPRARGEGSNP
jgi:two-component system CheB/CheR fusion protein